MKKFSYVCATLVMLISTIVLLSACNADDYDYEEEERIMDLLIKSWYGSDMLFHFRIVVDGEARILGGFSAVDRFNPSSRFHNPFYTDLIFVHSGAEADALNLPDNIIVAWPRDAEWTDGLIAGMHWAVNRTEDELPRRWEQLLRPVVTLEEFGLSYPITIEDLVDNWEKVNALWTTFTDNERSFIQRAAPAGGPYIPEPETDLAPTGGGDE